MPRPSHPVLVATALRATLPDGQPLFDIPHLALGSERVGLIGPNGGGKSTLLRLLAGELEPAAGQVQRRGLLGFLKQSRQALSEQTVGDALAVADAPAAPAALGKLGLAALPLDRPLRELSGGECTRVMLAAELLREPDLLLLDEPTNDLDAAGREALQCLVGSWPRGLLVASHDRALLQQVDRILLLDGGQLRSYGGNWSAYEAQRAIEREALAREHANAQASLARATRQAQAVRERQARRDASGKRTRRTGSQPKLVLNAKRERSQATNARLGATQGRVINQAAERLAALRQTLAAEDRLRMQLAPSGLPRGKTVVVLESATVGYGARAPILREQSLTVVGPERIAITGANGSGKTTLLQAAAGALPLRAGHRRLGIPEARLAFLDQGCALLDVGRSIREAFEHRHPRATPEQVHAALARFRFRAADADRVVTGLSGGERVRAALACVLGGPSVPQLLILDEPTNHLDLEHLEAVEAALRGYDGALLVVSHDRAFLAGLQLTRSYALDSLGQHREAQR